MKGVVSELFKIADRISEFMTEPYIYHYYYEPKKEEAAELKVAAEKRDAMGAFEDLLETLVERRKEEIGETAFPEVYDRIVKEVSGGGEFYTKISDMVDKVIEKLPEAAEE